MKCWVYHETKEPKIIDSDELTEHLGNGWEESPAKFVKTTDFGVEPDDVISVQALGETIEGVKDALNDQLNIEDMKPKDLKAFSVKHFGMEIKGNRAKLLTQVEALLNDDSTRNH